MGTDLPTAPNGVFTREFRPWMGKPGVTIRETVLGVRSAMPARIQSVKMRLATYLQHHDAPLGRVQTSSATNTKEQLEVCTGEDLFWHAWYTCPTG